MRNYRDRSAWPNRANMRAALAGAMILSSLLAWGDARAQCAMQQFQNYTGGGTTACPCFVSGEQAGAVFNLPASEYPIEILRVGVGWGSAFGGSGQTLEQAIHIYTGSIPNPGLPLFSLVGPQLTDGAINEFNLEPLPGEIRIESGSFMVTLEFMNTNQNDFFAGTVVSDGNGCQPGKNVIYAIPGGWGDACSAGVSGDWVFFVKYRSLKVTAGASPVSVAFSGVPFNQTTCDTVYVSNTGCDTLMIDGILGCGTSPFSLDTTMTSHSVPPGGQTPITVCVTPTSAATDNCTITVVSNAGNGPTMIPVSLDGVTAVSGPPVDNGFGILSVAPNPFNPQTTIRFVIPRALPVTAEVWAVDGSHVRTLAREQNFPAGDNALVWDGRSDGGQSVVSGVYFLSVKTALGRRVTRAVLLE
ncbi:MAG: hypothetical protein OEX18_00570 [Candidatus Krumholzibacteria bacterium]|nr:hypothetical protein [Candidatus Krumholzibacteria bacterium]MDH4335756.1 hypothetical protein [Candidatus Krumholzibacteria bacterium]MDH5269282.1 hypothetical protein [Candidatus Krumholzibacteria bacterium]